MRYFRSTLAYRFLGCLALAALISLPCRGQNATLQTPSSRPESAPPGTVNYVEGQAKIGSETLSSQSIGKVELQSGQTLETQNGRVELLLIPGVFLRVGQDTSVTMVSPSLTNLEVKVNAGEATAEVDEYHAQNNLMVQVDDATAYLVHNGFYDFDPQQGLIRVLKGQAVVLRNDRHVRVNQGGQVELFPQSAELKTTKFDAGQYKKDNPLYSWSKLRSQYLAEANVNEAPYFNGFYGPGWGPGWHGPGWWGPGYGWYGPGWYWNPWFMSYTFIPGAGMYSSPFGWHFYSPWTARSAPYAVEGGRVRHFDHGFDSWGLHSSQRRGLLHGPSRVTHPFHGRAATPGEHFGIYGGGFHPGGSPGGHSSHR